MRIRQNPQFLVLLALGLFLSPLASAQTTLFVDSFDRADRANIDAVLDGITDNTGSSLAADAVYSQPWLDPANNPTAGTAGDGGAARILSNQLELAVGAGTSNAYINHNFTNSSITDGGGFSVTVDVADDYDGTSGGANGQGGAFAVGMTQAEADAAEDALSTNAFTGNFTDNNGVADFWLGVRGDSTVEWGGAGLTAQSAGVAAKGGTIRASFSFPDFNVGTTVSYSVFYDGNVVGSGTFTWSDSDSNYIGLDARTSSAVKFDNLEVATLGVAAGLSSDPGYAPASVSSFPVTLSWSASGIPAGATYAITADQPVTFPDGDATGPAAPGSGSVAALVNGTLGNTTFTVTILDGATTVTSAQVVVRRQQPNVLVILADDLGFSDLGCYGGEIATPVIDNLAASGLQFTAGYNCSRCSPSRAAILTGQHPHSVFQNPGGSLSDLRTDNNITLAELLGDQGYATYAVGKWHLGESSAELPENRGFQHFWGFKDGPGQDPPYGKDVWDQTQYRFFSTGGALAARTYPDADAQGENGFHQTDAIGDYAADFINHAVDSDQPFFLYASFGAPHFPVQAPKSMIDARVPDYTTGFDTVRPARFESQKTIGLLSDPPYQLSPKSWSPAWAAFGPTPLPAWSGLSAAEQSFSTRMMATYAAMISQMDNNVGKMIAALEARGQLDNTLILFVSDNGGDHEGGTLGSIGFGWNNDFLDGSGELETLGMPGFPAPYYGASWANVSCSPFLYYKRACHEGGIRTPFVIHWPDGITRTGEREANPVHIIDLFSTVRDLTGFPLPASFDGHPVIPAEPQAVSLAPLFTSATPIPRELGFEHERNRGYRKGDWKLVTKNFSDDRHTADELELYYLPDDPVELNNLAVTNPAKVAEMIADWNAWATRVGVPADRQLSVPQPQIDPPVLPEDLFLDTFNRPNDGDPDASTVGMWGSRLGSMGPAAVYYDSHTAGETDLINQGLQMAISTAGMSENGVQHNFIGGDILTAGGFSVSLRVDNIVHGGSLPDPDRFGGFGVGLTQAEAQASADIFNTTPPLSFRGSGVGNGSADLFLELDIDENVKAYRNGTQLVSTAVGQNSGVLLASFGCSSFAAGAPVTVTAFLDGKLVDLDPVGAGDTLTFQWDSADANHIGLSARASTRVELDNFAIRALPPGGALVATYANLAGLSGADADPGADPDGDGDDNQTEWLQGSNPNGNGTQAKLLSLAPTPGGEFRFHWRRLVDAAAAGVTYRFRFSDDLLNWNDFTPEELSATPDGDSRELVLSRVPAADLDDPLNPGQMRQRLFVILAASP